jgi:hypothetical protein
MVSTEDMMSLEDQTARLKRQLDKKIITRDQYESKMAELERRSKSPQVQVTQSPTSASPTYASIPINKSAPTGMDVPRSETRVMSPSLRRLMSMHDSPIEPSPTEDQSALAKLQDLLDKGIITQEEYQKLVKDKKAELGIADEQQPSIAEIQQKMETETRKLRGLLDRGIIAQEEYDALIGEKNLFERGIITQEEYDRLNSRVSPVQLVRRNEPVRPEPVDENKTKLQEAAKLKRGQLDKMNVQIQQKRAELDKLVADFDQVAQELGQIENEIGQ